MNYYSLCSFAVLSFAATLILTMGTEAKRGCATFGHSCYGGMGKRAFDQELTGEILQDVEQENPETIFPGPRNSGAEDSWTPDGKFAVQRYNISPFLKQWLRKYLAEKESFRREK